MEPITESQELAIVCAQIAQSKKAVDLYVLDLSSLEDAPADYFVISTAESEIQAKSIADGIRRMCKSTGIERPTIEGEDNAQWILLDFFDVVVHIFQTDARGFYKLEKLWNDATFYCVNDEGELVPAAQREDRP